VALARAIAHRPRVLLLDEPYTGLDELASLSLADLLERWHAPDRVVLVTLHDVSRAITDPDRVIVLSRGRVVLDQTARASRDLAGDYLRVLRVEATT